MSQAAFACCECLKTAVVNEGLEVLGTNENDDHTCYGVFQCSAVENVELPSTLQRIEENAFFACTRLQSISLP